MTTFIRVIKKMTKVRKVNKEKKLSPAICGKYKETHSQTEESFKKLKSCPIIPLAKGIRSPILPTSNKLVKTLNKIVDQISLSDSPFSFKKEKYLENPSFDFCTSFLPNLFIVCFNHNQSNIDTNSFVSSQKY